MPASRPNPDELLAKVQADEAKAHRGSLRIFFGYAAGVGKTYAMLESAHHAIRQGRDVVVGYVEPHARPETQALAEGLKSLPVREAEYRGVTLREFDVDSALQSRPEVLLVDELAHSNAPGSRHEKRWQDVVDLLDAGINVWTTLNVQHIESLNDVIGQITGVTVRETIPDYVFDSAEEIELIDVTPEELVERLQAGKIYLPEQAQRAIAKFFQKPNLTALRELSMRQAARRVHSDVELERAGQSVDVPWATSDRLLVCAGPSPTTARVIRTACRMAAALDAPWMAVSVDLTGQSVDSPAAQQVSNHFRLAERLGAETITLSGQNVAEAVLSFARDRNVTKILIGKTNQPRWRRLIFGTVVDEILEQCGDIDVYVIHGEAEQPTSLERHSRPSAFDWKSYLKASLTIGTAAAVARFAQYFQLADAEANTVMVFLAAVAAVAYRFGRGPAVFGSVLAVAVFDVFFVPPFYTFAVADAQYIVTFAVMLAIGLTISTLTSRLRAQVERSRLRERQTASLYELGKQLSSQYGSAFLTQSAGRKIGEMLQADVVIYLKQDGQALEIAFGAASPIASHRLSESVAEWVIAHDQKAGAGTNTLPDATALFIPLTGAQRTHGAIAIGGPQQQRFLDPIARQLLDACSRQLALALERDQMAIAAADARVEAETERVRSGLLSSVSHDLKTPLASIAGASSTLLQFESIDLTTRRELLQSIADESLRLNRLLENILQMSKLDAGVLPQNKQWHLLEELVGSALHRLRNELKDHDVSVELPQDLPLVLVDGVLMEQVFANLLENATRYTPPGTKIRIDAQVNGNRLQVRLSDNGPGLPAGMEERIFDKFFRVHPTADGGRGSGLGLAICRAVLQVHGGTIKAANRAGGGAEFLVTLPMKSESPRVVIE